MPGRSRSSGPTGRSRSSLSRQKVPTLDRSELAPASGLERGAYTLWESSTGARPDPDRHRRRGRARRSRRAASWLPTGTAVRVVSMPCWELFAEQPSEYRDEVLPPDVQRAAVGRAGGRARLEADGSVTAATRSRSSISERRRPGATVLAEFGYNLDNVVARATALLERVAVMRVRPTRSRQFLALVSPGFCMEGELPAVQVEAIEVRHDGHAIARVRGRRSHRCRSGSRSTRARSPGSRFYERPESMKVAVAFDHRGVHLRAAVLESLAGHEVVDFGTDTDAVRIDYPDKAREVGEAIQRGEAERAVLVCGSGVGAAVAACKMTGIRAAICHDTYSAHQGVEHDDMNVLCLGSEVVGPSLARELVEAFLGATFNGGERYVERLAEGRRDGKGDEGWLRVTSPRARRARAVGVVRHALARPRPLGRAEADDGRGRRRRRHVESDDLPEGALDGRRLRRGPASSSSTRPTTRRRSSSRSRCRTFATRATCSSRRTTRRAASTATSRWRSSPASRTTPRRRSSRSSGSRSEVDRPNLYVKIPATEPGLPAIED